MDCVDFCRNEDCSISTNTENSFPTEFDNCRETESLPQIPSDSHDSNYNIFGEPEVTPRVGEEYQAILPPLFELESHSKRPQESKTQTYPDHILSEYSTMLSWRHCGELRGFPTEEEIKTCGGGSCDNLVTGFANFSWNVLEKDSFLLGLYVFEKNFALVKRLVPTKNMGAVLSFYYGQFYRSPEYHRWSDCRKAKSKKGIGQRIFSGARQQELLNRILGGVSEDIQNDVLEASKMFGEDRMLLSDYIFSLIRMIGIETRVSVVSIGKGKLDLTEMPSELRLEIPTGKALSSLTSHAIVKILSGNYRISKAQSNNIFWEAIWPRLLARGWHSEQPDNQGLLRHCLVFIIPGIKKFSRRDLVKGEHYFDSLTDILSKVVKEPELINLEFGGDVDGKKEECEILVEKEKQYYLKVKTLNRNTDVVKLTVVDTSLLGGKVREMRSFPSQYSGSNCADADMLDWSVGFDHNGKATGKSEKKPSLVPGVKKDRNRVKKVSRGPLKKRCRKLITDDDREEKNVHPPVLIDLNLPEAPPEPENEELCRDHQSEKVLNLNPRRVSTRYRLPTMRAMEAVASGYLAVSRSRKGKAKCTGGVVVGPTRSCVGESVESSGSLNVAAESRVPTGDAIFGQ